MVLQTKPIPIDEFRKFVNLPENSELMFELIDGEIIEVSPGRTSNSEIRDILAFEVRLFCRELDIPCHTSGGDAAYDILGHVIAPDFAYKRTPMSEEYPDRVAPEWAVEVISPTDKAPDIRAKRQIYIQAGILYGELYPKSQSIDVYAPGEPPRTLGINDTLDGGDVLPGFTLAIKKLFA
jgi:Uma2 family endonuclease